MVCTYSGIRCTSSAPKAKKQVVLDGPVSCGKSIALAMLVHWARERGLASSVCP